MEFRITLALLSEVNCFSVAEESSDTKGGKVAIWIPVVVALIGAGTTVSTAILTNQNTHLKEKLEAVETASKAQSQLLAKPAADDKGQVEPATSKVSAVGFTKMWFIKGRANPTYPGKAGLGTTLKSLALAFPQGKVTEFGNFRVEFPEGPFTSASYRIDRKSEAVTAILYNLRSPEVHAALREQAVAVYGPDSLKTLMLGKVMEWKVGTVDISLDESSLTVNRS